jgi:hypothetical protein
MFFLREGGVRLGLVVEGVGGCPGLLAILPVTTYPLQCRGLELDMQETSATEVCVSTFSFFFGKRECAWDLLLKEKVGASDLYL